MQIIPVTDTYAQTFSVTLGGQDCTLNLYQRPAGLFIDVSVAGTLIIGGVICRNTTRVVRDAYGVKEFNQLRGKAISLHSQAREGARLPPHKKIVPGGATSFRQPAASGGAARGDRSDGRLCL